MVSTFSEHACCTSKVEAREGERERDTIGSRVHFFNTEMHKTDVHRFTHTHMYVIF